MNLFTNCPSCKHAIFYGYGNGFGCCLEECRYEPANHNNTVITSIRTLTNEELKSLLGGKAVSDMREILFRGKTNSGDWVYGDLLNVGVDYDYAIRTYGGREHGQVNSVNEKTVGQYTGLTDKNGKNIFEGDIVKNDWCFMCGNSVIKFGQYKPLDMGNEYQQGHLGFYLEHIHKADKRSVRKDIVFFANNCEIIGNIHDNPELLKGE